MAKAFFVALAAGIFGLSGMASDAAATVTFSLVWQTTTGAGVTGGSAIDAAPGDVLTLGLVMTNEQTLGSHAVSLMFDTDLGNELNLYNPNGGANWSGTTYGTSTMTSTYAPIAPIGSGGLTVYESTSAIPGRIHSFHSILEIWGPPFLPTGTYLVGTARFVANTVTADGADVFAGLFNPGIDGVFDEIGFELPTNALVFGSASVNPIPEPDTAALVGLGLVGIVVVARRRARS